MTPTPPPRPVFGQLLRRWRRTRGWSQLTLGLEASVPQRHVSFLETGRARPGEEMVLRLCAALDLPLAERNGMLTAAGFPPAYAEQRLGVSKASSFFQDAILMTLEAHAPYPALALNGWWDITHTNPPAATLLEGADNLVHAIFDPGPMRARVRNWPDVARASFTRLSREAREHPSDARLQSLAEHAAARLSDAAVRPCEPGPRPETLAVCPEIEVGPHTVRLLTMVARFASVQDLALEEARVELLFPADAESAAVLRSLVAPIHSDNDPA